MSDFTITIVGAGVIGTSIGLALKQEKDPPRLLVHDKDLKHAGAAVKMGAFDKAEWNLINACDKADLIILATPLNGIRSTLEAIAPYLKAGVVISDTASSKSPPLVWAKELLPDQAHFVGGHPIVHPPGVGYEHATADLFHNTLYCLTPGPAANEQAVQLMVGVTSLLGAEPFFLDAAEHDGLIVAVEHLPTLISAALVGTLASQASWRELRKMAGRLFEQVSAGAVGDPDSIKDSLLSDTDNLVHWLDSYTTQLNHLRMLLTDTDASAENLVELLDDIIVERQRWLIDRAESRFNKPDLPEMDIGKPGLIRRFIGFGR